MSHIMTLEVKFQNLEILERVARELGCEVLGQRDHRLWGGSEAGLGIKLEGWSYPIVVKDDGTVKYDNYGGSWGDIERLNELTQKYVAGVVWAEATAQGQSVWEQVAEDGTLVLTISGNVAGW